MDPLHDVNRWAEENFGGAVLGDKRRTERLVFSAARIARHPGRPFTQTFDWNELRGFYGVCNCEQATHDAVSLGHWRKTRQAMADEPVALILHDTTELDFTSHKALRGQGPVGEGTTTGFLQHNSLAVTPRPRRVLGLACQQFVVRKPAPPGETSYQRRRRAGRESLMWPRGIKASGKAPEGRLWVDVGDRGADIYEAMGQARELDHHFLFRVKQNRKVYLNEDKTRSAYLKDYARSLPAKGKDEVRIEGRGGRGPRTAKVELASATVWVPASAEVPRRASQPVCQAWVLRVWEPNPPEEAEDAIDWILLCSVPSETLEELRERRDWYSCRWMVEIFHDIEKNGCGMEDRRFETAGAMAPCLAVLGIVAARVFQLRCALESQPDEPAEQVATTLEIAVMKTYLGHDKRRRFTVRDFVLGVAKLGGYLGRKGDGPPGVRTLWKGYERFQDMMMAAELLAKAP